MVSALHLPHSAVPFAFVYVGKTVDFRRRSVEHMLRVIGSDGVTQQPFYQVVRRGCDSNAQCAAALCFLMLLPVRLACADRGERLIAECQLCQAAGNLNPPRVYSVLRQNKRSAAGLRLFDSKRVVSRLQVCANLLPKMSALESFTFPSEKSGVNVLKRLPLVLRSALF